MMTRLRACLMLLVVSVLIGRITDATTGQPLPHVTVVLSGKTHRTTTTDIAGKYRFVRVAPGRYTLAIHSHDVPPMSRHVTVRSGSTTADITACSTTLDYSCAAAIPGPG